MPQKKIRKFHKVMVLIIHTHRGTGKPRACVLPCERKTLPMSCKSIERNVSTSPYSNTQVGSIQQKRVQCFVASMKWLVMVKGSS